MYPTVQPRFAIFVNHGLSEHVLEIEVQLMKGKRRRPRPVHDWRPRSGAFLRISCAVLLALLTSSRGQGAIPQDAAIRRILVDRVGDAQGVGIVVAITGPHLR